MNVLGVVVCAMSQVLDPAPAPVAVPPPLVIYEWIGLDGSLREGALISIEKGVARIRESRGGDSAIALSTLASAWRVSAAPIARSIEPTENVENDGAGSAESATPASALVWTIQLTDGQRLRGEFAESSAAESITLALSAKTLSQDATTNAVTLPLERLSRAWGGPQWPRSAQRTVGDSSRDVLWLANGDVISGFVSDLGRTIKIELPGSQSSAPAAQATGAKVQEISLASVAAISLTNPDVAPTGLMSGWEDGSMTALSSLSVNDHVCRAVLAVAPEVIQRHPLSALLFIVPDASRWRSLRADGAGPSGALMANGEGVLLSEPGNYSWPVKQGETNFVAQVALSSSCFDWGDCTLIVRTVGGKPGAAQEAARLHIDAENPQHRLNVSIAGATSIEFTIDPGPSGPVQDRLQLSRAGFIAAPRK